LVPASVRGRALALALLLLAGAPAQAQDQAQDQVRGQPQSLPTEPLAIHTRHGWVRFTVEVADTDETREIGLMFRKSLAPDRGMLFDFHAAQPVAFWMKNTVIPLDMLFIAADGRVVSIARHATPLSETPIPSGGPVLGVLEIPGDRAEALGVRPGDRVRERIFPKE